MADKVTSNYNVLQSNNFKVVINRENYPNLQYFAQSFSHPGVAIDAPELPYKRLRRVATPGETLTYGELNVMLLVDEDYRAPQEMYDWMVRLTETAQSKTVGTAPSEQPPLQADVSIEVQTSHNNANFIFQYIDAVPVAIGDMELNSAVAGVDPIILPVTFSYSYFKIIR